MVDYSLVENDSYNVTEDLSDYSRALKRHYIEQMTLGKSEHYRVACENRFKEISNTSWYSLSFEAQISLRNAYVAEAEELALTVFFLYS